MYGFSILIFFKRSTIPQGPKLDGTTRYVFYQVVITIFRFIYDENDVLLQMQYDYYISILAKENNSLIKLITH
jgi:hypothetical protein